MNQRQIQQIEDVENDLATLSSIDEATRILALRVREPHNIAELRRIRDGIKRIQERAKARRKNIRQ